MAKIDKREEAKRLNQLAREAESRGDWGAAEIHFRSYIDVDPERPWIYVALANALTRQGKLDDAGKVLWKAAGLFPNEPSVAAEAATFAQVQGDLPDALVRWDEVIRRFPESWLGVRGKMSALSQCGRSAEADTLFAEKAPHFQHDGNALHDIARAAERRKDWDRAANTWRSFINLNDKMSWAFVGLYRALLEQDRLLEARSVVDEARERFPGDAAIIRDAASLYDRLEDWAEAGKCWRSLAKLKPQSSDAAIAESESLRRRGRFKEADDILKAEIGRLGNEVALLDAFGLNAMAKEDWPEALSRFEAAQGFHPTENRFTTRIFEVRLRLADSGTHAPAPRPTAADVSDLSAEDRALVAAFESLGGTGHGCEFGIFQRHFGAEPLGLLRWADLSHDQLSMALENEFAGVGESEFTKVFVPKTAGKPEYWTTDTRYHMAMRCFVMEEEVPLERMTRQVTNRLKFLRAKLIDDLHAGEKIFVYKNMKRNLRDAELNRLYAALRRYGENTLLYIRYQDSQHPAGTVVEDRPGLLLGYVDRFSHAPDTDQFLGSSNDAFLQVCRSAYRLFQERKANAAADPPLGTAGDATPRDAPPLSNPVVLTGYVAKSIVFLGNCQAGTLANLYKEVVAGETGERVFYVPSYQAANTEAASRVASADVLVRQVLDFAPATAELDSRGRTVLFPLVSAPFLWPCSGTKHPRNAPAPYLDDAGPYGAEIGDSYLNRMIARAVPSAQAAAEYLAANIVVERRVDAMREMIMEKQRKRDLDCGDYGLYQFIENNIVSTKIFRTANHPELPLTFRLAEEVFERVGVPAGSISSVQAYNGQLFPKTEAPIHPSIATHFGLRYANRETRYQYFDEGKFTFEEFAARYVDYVWNPDLPYGVHLAHQGDLIAALAVLRRAVEASPRSAWGSSALSTVLAKLGEWDEAVLFAHRAADLAPEDAHLQRLLAHYERQLASRTLDVRAS